jgi:hypothetical protein
MVENATNRESSDAQQIQFQPLLEINRDVHVMPSGLVITRSLTPEKATATKIDNSGAQQTSRHALSAADVRVVQLIPSGLVITRFPVPPASATATNNDSSGAQHTEIQ